MYDFSIVIPYYNKRMEIDLQLMSLFLQDYDKKKFEIIIIDDGSDERLDAILEKYEPALNIRYIYIAHTGNRAANRNYGIKQCNGNRIVMLDSDIIVEKDMLSQFDKATKEDRKIISLGMRNLLIGFDKQWIDANIVKESFEIIPSLPALNDERTISVILKNDYGIEYEGNWQLFFSHCLCLWRDEFLEIGGFDEQFDKNWGAEDIELGYRLFLNGCKITLNENVNCYHIYHYVKLKENILSLKKNYSLLLKKHRCWQVELFIKEYQLWAVEVHDISKKIKRREFAVNRLKGSDKWICALPNKVLLVGVEDQVLLNTEKIEIAFIPESSFKSEKIQNIIGFETDYPDEKFNIALISEKYENINKGLYKSLVNEISRISKKCIIVNETTDVGELTNRRTISKNGLKDDLYLLFSLSDESVYDFERNNFLNLAIAADQIGIHVGIQHAFDPFKKLNINYGYQWISNENKNEKIKKLQAHEYNFMSDEIYHFIDIDWLPSSIRSMEKKIAWIDTAFINHEQFISPMAEEAEIVMFKREWEMEKYQNVKRKYHLPCGVDKNKIELIKTRKVTRNDKFTFLCTDQFFNQFSNIDILVEVFNELYKNDNSVQLKIISSGQFSSPTVIPDSFSSKSIGFIINTLEERIRYDQKSYIDNLKSMSSSSGNISIIEENMSDEEYSNEIYDCDCFINLNSTSRVVTSVLEAFAFGKKSIIPYDERYDGYISKENCFPLETKRISTIFMEKNSWPIHDSIHPQHHYLLVNKIKKESLIKTMLDINKKNDNCIISDKDSSEYLEKYNWIAIAERMKNILFS